MDSHPDLPPGMVGTGQNGDSLDVGALMRASRHRLGAEIQDAAQTLRIRATYLDAIEDGRFEDLPGPTYTAGFIRAYAEYLGLDGAEVVRRFKAASESAAPAQKLSFPTPVPDRGLPGGAILMIGIFIAVIGYGGWYVYSSRDNVLAELVPAVPERLSQVLKDNGAGGDSAADSRTIDSKPASAGSSAPPAAVAATPPAPEPETASSVLPPIEPPPAPAAVETAPLEDAARPAEPAESAESREISAEPALAMPERVAAAQAPAEAPAPEPESEQAVMVDATPAEVAEARIDRSIEPAPAAAPQAAAPAMPAPDAAAPRGDAAQPVPAAASETAQPNIEVRAKADSWIQVRDDSADQLVLTRLLKGGDSYSVPPRQGLTLLTGNAGALQIVVDGEVVPSIGPLGAVRRRVALDAQRLKSGTAVIE